MFTESTQVLSGITRFVVWSYSACVPTCSPLTTWFQIRSARLLFLTSTLVYCRRMLAVFEAWRFFANLLGTKMRSRSNSGVKLDNYARIVHQTILRHQVSVSFLHWCFPKKLVFTNHAFIHWSSYSRHLSTISFIVLIVDILVLGSVFMYIIEKYCSSVFLVFC